MDNICLKFPLYLLDSLRKIKFPFHNIDQFTGIKSESIVVLSDFGSDDSKYDVIAYYIVDFNNSKNIVDLLKNRKTKYKIQERTIDYKGRKDKMKLKAFSDWIAIVQSYPGIIYVVAFDKRMERSQEHKNEVKILQREVLKRGIYDKVEIGLRMLKALSFLVFIGPLLEEKHKLCWVSDNDAIFDTPIRHEALATSMADIANTVIKHRLAAFGYATPFKDKKQFQHFEEMLSIADMAAGSFAASLQHEKTNRLSYPDVETKEIIEEFSRIKDVSDYKIERFLYPIFGLSVFDLEYTEENRPYYSHKRLKLKALQSKPRRCIEGHL